ncbi:MAG TPA: hypothetical protein VMM92_01585, partial [Thermoanaerobaculia bacterium]|nr:hypothetical protein [Thermoanaerobaculia bacterium]
LPADCPLEERAARLLRRFCERALDAGEEGRLVLGYGGSMAEALRLTLRHFGITLNTEESSRAREALGSYAKEVFRERPYSDDGPGKRARASLALRRAAEEWLGETHARLVEVARES